MVIDFLEKTQKIKKKKNKKSILQYKTFWNITEVYI
jgi:hypothetical protein